MNLLLDTHIWLWWLLSPEKLSKKNKEMIADPKNVIYLSAASSWEIVVKADLDKIKLPLSPKEYIPKRLMEEGMLSLPILQSHALQISELPLHHKDPFDRLLIAQSQIEAMPILTADKKFKPYDVEIISTN